MKKFKGMLLACDMDGTLLDDSKQIPAENLRALQYFTKQGGRLSLATGRSPHAIGIYIDQLPVNAPYSVMNGSLICDENRKILYCSGMPYETKEMIEHVLNGYGTEAYSVCDQMPWYNEKSAVSYDPEQAEQLLNEAGWKMAFC